MIFGEMSGFLFADRKTLAALIGEADQLFNRQACCDAVQFGGVNVRVYKKVKLY